MVEYRRPKVSGGSYFFTVNRAERRGIQTLTGNIDLLRQSFRKMKQTHPFSIDAIVILPGHLKPDGNIRGGE
jgi:putative transposase